MTRPNPYPRPAPTSPPAEALAAFGQWVLSLHQLAEDPHWCTCGQNVVLCPYRTGATRYLGPPSR
ncbi:MAG TPA: hypothetical protein VFX70_22610 [Mycobacteriales bacterium]|nr:hypothetical protein [Mycobacteriales bacterium]